MTLLEIIRSKAIGFGVLCAITTPHPAVAQAPSVGAAASCYLVCEDRTQASRFYGKTDRDERERKVLAKLVAHLNDPSYRTRFIWPFAAYHPSVAQSGTPYPPVFVVTFRPGKIGVSLRNSRGYVFEEYDVSINPPFVGVEADDFINHFIKNFLSRYLAECGGRTGYQVFRDALVARKFALGTRPFLYANGKCVLPLDYQSFSFLEGAMIRLNCRAFCQGGTIEGCFEGIVQAYAMPYDPKWNGQKGDPYRALALKLSGCTAGREPANDQASRLLAADVLRGCRYNCSFWLSRYEGPSNPSAPPDPSDPSLPLTLDENDQRVTDLRPNVAGVRAAGTATSQSAEITNQ